MDFRGDDDCAPHPLSKNPYTVLPMFKVLWTIIISTSWDSDLAKLGSQRENASDLKEQIEYTNIRIEAHKEKYKIFWKGIHLLKKNILSVKRIPKKRQKN